MPRNADPKTNKAASAASLLGKRSARARTEQWGKKEFTRRMREWGKLGGRPKKNQPPEIEQVIRSFPQAANGDMKKLGRIITDTVAELPRAHRKDYLRELKRELDDFFGQML